MSNALRHGIRIVLNIEIPEPQNTPASFSEHCVLLAVAGDISLDLLVPVAAPTTRLPLARVAVPERPVDKDGDLPACEGHVDSATGSTPVATKSPEALAPQCGTEQLLGSRVRAADARHDAASAFRRSGGSAERV